MTNPKAISLSDIIREFERDNFHHVNDVDPRKVMSSQYCASVVALAAKLTRERAVNAALVEAVESLLEWVERNHEMPGYSESIAVAREALARAEEMKNK